MVMSYPWSNESKQRLRHVTPCVVYAFSSTLQACVCATKLFVSSVSAINTADYLVVCGCTRSFKVCVRSLDRFRNLNLWTSREFRGIFYHQAPASAACACYEYDVDGVPLPWPWSQVAVEQQKNEVALQKREGEKPGKYLLIIFKNLLLRNYLHY